MLGGFFQDLPSTSGASWNVWSSELESGIIPYYLWLSTKRRILECFHAILKKQKKKKNWKNILSEMPLVKLKQSNQRERSRRDSQIVFIETFQKHRPIYRVALNSWAITSLQAFVSSLKCSTSLMLSSITQHRTEVNTPASSLAKINFYVRLKPQFWVIPSNF